MKPKYKLIVTELQKFIEDYSGIEYLKADDRANGELMVIRVIARILRKGGVK